MAQSLQNFVSQFQSPFMTGLVHKITNVGLFVRRLNFITVDGFSYSYGEEASLGGIYYRALNEPYPTGDYGVVNPKIETMPIFGGEIRTDMQMVNKQGNSARANEIARRMHRAALFFDREIIKGSRADEPKAMNGLYTRLTGNQVIEMATNGANLTYEKVDELIDRVYGKASEKILVMNKAARRQLKNDLLANAGGTSLQEVAGGLEAYDGISIEILDEDGDDDPILDFDETCGANDHTTSVLCIHLGSTTDREGMQGLVGSQGIERNEGGCMGTYFLDVIDANMGFAVFHPRAAARLKGITAAPPS